MNVAQPSSEKPAHADLKAKREPGTQEQDALEHLSVYAGGKTSSPASGDDSGNQGTHIAISAAAQLQRSLGNQAVLRRVESARDLAGLDPLFPLQPIIGNQGTARRLQTKLKVNTPGDCYEQEADRVAEQVMRTSAASAVDALAMSGGVPAVQRKCSCGGGSATPCEKCQKDEPMLQRSASTPAALPYAPPIAHEVLRSPGMPLGASTRAFMEPRFSRDFSQVRIHIDAHAADSARSLQARAYTVGRDIVFGAGEHVPESPEGRRLLAHELAHVVQQSGANPASWETPASQRALSGGRQLMPRLTPAGATAVQRQPQAAPAPADPELAKVLRAAARAKKATGVQAMIASSEVIFGLIDLYMPRYADIIGVRYADGGKGVTARKSGAFIDVTVTREFILRLDQSNVGMMVIELRDALRKTGVVPSPAAPQKRLGMLSAIRLDYQLKKAQDAHEAQVQRVKQIFTAALAVPRGTSAFTVFQNSIEWIANKKFQLVILTPTHDSGTRKQGMRAYFDRQKIYSDTETTTGATYDPTGADDTGVEYKTLGTLGEAMGYVPRSSLKTFSIKLFLEQQLVSHEELSELLVHETQHMADRVVSGSSTGAAAVEQGYQTEFHSYWLETPVEEQVDIGFGRWEDKSAARRRSDPLYRGPRSLHDFGSEAPQKISYPFRGKESKHIPLCNAKLPGCNFETKEVTTNFTNQKQKGIFEHLMSLEDRVFDCYYVCDSKFKDMVDKLSGPVGVNLVNSIRIDALLDIVDGCDDKMLVTDPRMERVMAAVERLDDLDKSFLRSSLPAFPAELKEEAKRKAEEEEKKKKIDLSSLRGQPSQSKEEEHQAPVSFWLYLSRKLPPDGLKKIQQAIKVSQTPGKKP